jgi:hypothetical protein
LKELKTFYNFPSGCWLRSFGLLHKAKNARNGSEGYVFSSYNPFVNINSICPFPEFKLGEKQIEN